MDDTGPVVLTVVASARPEVEDIGLAPGVATTSARPGSENADSVPEAAELATQVANVRMPAVVRCAGRVVYAVMVP